jgi:alpha-ketoglutaric semialdehyde dehydrogenase
MSARQLTALQGSMLLDGEWVDSGRAAENIDPSTGEAFATLSLGSAADVEHAVAAARAALPGWASTAAPARARILYAAAQELDRDAESWADLMAREMGKPVGEARLECLRAGAILRYYAGEAQRPIGQHYASDSAATWLFTRREPVGVVGIITPWNFPAAIPAWKTVPALIFGNTVVLKLATDAALTGLRFAQALQSAGLPPGVLNVVLGSGSELGGRLVEHPEVAAISFTGSTEVGRRIIAQGAAAGKRVQAEMGGHNPAVVLADANLRQALDAVALGAFASAGQKCTATRRVYVARARYDEFLSGLSERASALRVGRATDPATQLGPLAGASQLDGVHASVQAARGEGELVCGGDRGAPEGLANGCFFLPTVFADVATNGVLATQEVFGPIVSVWPMDDGEIPADLANRTPFGLSAAIFTRDLNAARDFAEQVRAGIVHVNSQTAGAEVHVPFGGTRDSSYGPHEQGRSAMEFYTEEKTVYLDPAAPS